MKKLSISLLLFFAAFSCKDYLEEELVSQVSYTHYNTEAGIEDLVEGIYGDGLRWMFNGEQSFTLFNYGVDEYMKASDGQNGHYDSYGSQLNSSAAYIHDMWTTYYRCINMANIAIDKINAITPASANIVYKTDAFKQQRLGEVRFLRGYFYFELVQQFGSIPLVLDGSIGVRTEFERTPVSAIYQQIIADFTYARTVLPASQSQYGRITRGAAQHYLAKAFLTRGSAVTEQSIRGTQPTDLDSAAYWADQVINSNVYSLVPNFADLWKIENEVNPEVILVAPFNNNALLLNGSGNRVHLYYQMTYDNTGPNVIPGMARDVANGRPFRRLMPTSYTYDVSDRKNDSRFYKSFKTAYIANTNSANIPVWTADNAPSPDKIGKKKFAVGDTALFLSLNTGVSAAEKSKAPYKWVTRDDFNLNEFFTLLKFLDPTRLDVSIETAQRDGVHARLGETYLIAAEAYGRKGDYVTATARLNKLRERAAYKDGEAKPVHFHKVEGGTFGDVTGTYTAIELPADGSYWDAAPSSELYPESAVDKATRFVHFMLNERTRELLGELHRWKDLVRTETFEERVKKFNPNTKENIQPYHKLRPIPQEHIDRLWRNGAPLTDPSARTAEQNPGYAGD